MIENKRVLTGVKPTGDIHIGNLYGAILPAIKTSLQTNQHIMFIADYHAVNALKDAQKLKQAVKEIACIYLAAGLDANKSIFYRQSDIPELFELSVILNAFTPKGFMNKSHAYKAQVDKNLAKNLPNDDGINMGLYTYPVLMAADILAFDTQVVPVGKDQIQHVEIARDIAGAINAFYNQDILTLPEYICEEKAATVVGTDGRKMSKSYNNVIPLCATDAEIKKAVFSIVTDSRPMEEPKDPGEILVYQIFKSIANEDRRLEMQQGLQQGRLGYGHIKNMLLDEILTQTKDLREKFAYYMANYNEVEDLLAKGAQKARPLAQKTLLRLKNCVLG